MVTPRSPRTDGSLESHHHKPALRTPGSPPSNKDLKVRFAEVDEVTEFDASSPPKATAAAVAAAQQNSTTQAAYWAAQQMPPQGLPHPYMSPSAAAPAPPPGTAPPVGQPQQQQYPNAAPYGYYYNPYAYGHYATMPAQTWPPQQQPGQPVVPEQSTAAASQESKRMQLLARSVSITVNPPQQEDVTAAAASGAAYMPVNHGAVAGSSGPGGMFPQPTGRFAAAPETEEAKESQSILWAQRRLRWSCMHRAFKGWSRLTEERWWKTQLALRDQQSQILAAQVRHLESRPVRYIKRYRMKQIVRAWVAYCNRKRMKAAAIQRAQLHAARVLLFRAFTGWLAAAQERTQEAAAEFRAEELHKRRRRRAMFASWRKLVGRRARKEMLLREAEKTRTLRLLRNAFGSWAYLAHYYRTEKTSISSRKLKTLSAAFEAWKARAQLKKYYAVLIQRFRAQHARRLRHWAFQAWLAYTDGDSARIAHEFHAQLSTEMERLRLDNERLARVVDSGDWGRDRVSELTQAGEVLKQERDALLKLVESLPGNRLRRPSRLTTTQQNDVPNAAGGASQSRRSSVATAPSNGKSTASGQQVVGAAAGSRRNSEIPAPAQVKRASISSAAAAAMAAIPAAPPKADASQKGPKPAPLPANLRHKMTIKSGSSFNALVRALKQDLITSGALARDPQAAFAVDKLSTQHVECVTTEDGSIKIEAVENTATTPGFSFAKAGLRKPSPKRDTSENEEHQHSVEAGKFGGRSVGIGKFSIDAAAAE